MSIQLIHKDVPHHAIHDIESFYYVLLFVTMMFAGPRKEISYKDRHTSGIFGKANDYLDHRPSTLEKSAMLNDFETLDKTLDAMTPYFSGIKQLMVDLCSVVFSTSGDNILVFKPKGTHDAFKKLLKEYYEQLPSVTPADIPDDLYVLSKRPRTAVKSSKNLHPPTPFSSHATTYAHSGSTSSTYHSGRQPRHTTGTHSLSSHSMSLRMRADNSNSKKRTSDQSGDTHPHSLVVPKRSRGSRTRTHERANI